MLYEAYYELAERTGWRVTDLDWNQLQADADAGLISDFDRSALMGTAVIEHGVPHYSEVWSLVEGLRDHWELWQFTTLWTGEEHRHSFSLKRACDLLGLPISEDLGTVTKFRFAEAQKQSCELDCYRTVPGMLTYAMIQEVATNRFYLMTAKRSQSPFLKKLFTLIGNDEMRHHCFYRDMLRRTYEESTDRAAFLDQVFHSVMSFKMPHLIYNIQTEFLESSEWAVREDIITTIGRCLSFAPELIARLVATHAAAASAAPAPSPAAAS
ncbi:MAG TPA: acyl-ACP desaturase [Kofleriaceae bacterium]|nr:acyl-ACP desaturase [Kofleriaceae bacterium]